MEVYWYTLVIYSYTGTSYTKKSDLHFLTLSIVELYGVNTILEIPRKFTQPQMVGPRLLPPPPPPPPPRIIRTWVRG